MHVRTMAWHATLWKVECQYERPNQSSLCCGYMMYRRQRGSLELILCSMWLWVSPELVHDLLNITVLEKLRYRMTLSCWLYSWGSSLLQMLIHEPLSPRAIWVCLIANYKNLKFRQEVLCEWLKFRQEVLLGEDWWIRDLIMLQEWVVLEDTL